MCKAIEPNKSVQQRATSHALCIGGHISRQEWKEISFGSVICAMA